MTPARFPQRLAGIIVRDAGAMENRDMVSGQGRTCIVKELCSVEGKRERQKDRPKERIIQKNSKTQRQTEKTYEREKKKIERKREREWAEKKKGKKE